MRALFNRLERPLRKPDPEMKALDDAERRRAELAELLGAVSTTPEIHTFDSYQAGHQATILPFTARETTPEQAPHNPKQEITGLEPQANA